MAKQTSVALCALILLITAASASYALPSFRGYTGLMRIPTADSLNKAQWNAGLFAEDLDDATVNDWIANYGVAEGLEVGLNFFKEDPDASTDVWLNGKYRFLNETNQKPAVAAGIIDAADQTEITAYVVASKALITPLGCYEGQVINPRIHVGLGAGQFDGLFAGLSTYLGNRIEVMAEWDSQNWLAGARFRLTKDLTIHAGFSDIGDGGGFGIGASYGRYY